MTERVSLAQGSHTPEIVARVEHAGASRAPTVGREATGFERMGESGAWLHGVRKTGAWLPVRPGVPRRMLEADRVRAR
jgi:hypothetical protein